MTTESSDELYQLGVHDIEKTPSLGDGELSIEFQFESAAVFKRLADDIYESVEAGVREPLSNSITAVRRAQDLFGVENGVIEITYDKQNGSLIIKDNGIGISMDVLKEVLSVIGRSTSRDEGDLSGKYGIGFLACYKLVGTDGGFIMHTRSRKTDEQISGMWKPWGFDGDENNVLEGKLDEDEYGTKLMFPLKDKIDESDVREWVEKHSEWSRVPIIYQEYGSDGNIDYNEDFGIKRLEDGYSGHLIVIETDYFKVVASSTMKGKTLLLDSPIKRNQSTSYNSPMVYDIRLKDESGVVIKGPHKGLTPVSESEYNNMSDERKKGYVLESRLTKEDIRLPAPIGTRDKLKENTRFWTWIGDRIKSEYAKDLANKLRSLENVDDIRELDNQDYVFIRTAIGDLDLGADSPTEFDEGVQRELGVSLSNEVASVLNNLDTTIFRVKKGINVEASSARKVVNGLSLGDFIRKDIGEVYMAVTLNQVKCDAVWENGDTVVKVESTDAYDKYKKWLGWRLLKKVPSYIEGMDVSDETYKKLRDNGRTRRRTSSNIESRVLTVHGPKGESYNLEVSEIEKRYENRADDSNILVLFPANADYLISDYKKVTTTKIKMANCAVKTWDYLKDVDGIIHIREYLAFSLSENLHSTEGQLPISDLYEINDNLILHVLEDYVYNYYKDTDLSKVKKGVFELFDEESSLNKENYGYAVMNKGQLDKVRPFIRENNIKVVTGSAEIHNIHNHVEVSSDLYPYAISELEGWEETQEAELLQNLPFDENSYGVFKLLEFANDADIPPKSRGSSWAKDPLEEEFLTTKGQKSLREICKQGVPVFHLIPKWKLEHLFYEEQNVISRFEEYVVKNATKSIKGGELEEEYDNVIYIPTTEKRYNRVCEALEEQVYITSQSHYTTGSKYNVGPIPRIYAYARLYQWRNSETFKWLLAHIRKGSEWVYMVETLAEVHDAGFGIESVIDEF